MKTQRATTLNARAALPLVATALLIGGCRSTPATTPGTRIDRLMNTYEPMNTGRFVVVADFEDPAHMELVTFSTNSPGANFVASQEGGRPETGPACLKLNVTGPSDTVIFSNEASSAWYLKRDWRSYDAMLLAVHVPYDGLTAHITLASGADANRIAVATTQRLLPGWNAMSLALAEVAERIAIDDIREIRISFRGVRQPTQILLDDLIITADRTTIFGDPQNLDGGLYAQHVADRILVGAGGNFELVFDNAQIVQWFDLAGDPHRLRNRVTNAALGPTPVRVDMPSDGEPQPLVPGSAVLADQRLLEVNEVRAIVECRWHFVDNPDDPIDNRPMVRRTFAIYASGRVFVTVEAEIGKLAWSSEQVGLAVTLADPDGGRTDVGIGAPPRRASETGGIYAWAAPQPDGASLLYVVTSGDAQLTVSDRRNEQTHLTHLIAVGQDGGTSRREWHSHLVLRLPEEDPRAVAADLAAAYFNPPPLGLQVGTLDQQRDTSGFDRATGTYRLRPESGRLRFTLGGNRTGAAETAFTVLETSGVDTWVYVDDVLHEQTARDADGNLVFQTTPPADREAVVEVLTRQRKTNPRP